MIGFIFRFDGAQSKHRHIRRLRRFIVPKHSPGSSLLPHGNRETASSTLGSDQPPKMGKNDLGLPVIWGGISPQWLRRLTARV